MRQYAPVIVIIGAPGVGKSTLAHALMNRIHIMQGTGMSVILYALRSLKPKHPALRRITTLDPEISLPALRKILYRQARYLAPVVNFIIQKFATSGVPFVVEGRHVFPSMLHVRYITLCVVIAAPSKTIYHQWLTNPKSKRRVTPHSVELGQKINTILLEQARHSGIPIIREIDQRKRIAIILRLLRRRNIHFTASNKYRSSLHIQNVPSRTGSRRSK